MHPALSLDRLDRLKYPFDDISAGDPGVVAAVAVNGESVWQRASGTAGDGAQLSTTTPFYVASVAKQFTAACVGLLANDQSFDPDDAVVDYIPDLPRSFVNVRVTDLVHHLSGIPSLETVAADYGWQVDWWHGLGT